MKLELILILYFISFISSKERKKIYLREEIPEEPILRQSEIEYTNNNNVFELKSDYIITQIGWTKKDEYKYNHLLGIFEGANDPSFSDAIPIAMIKEQYLFI